MPNPKRSLKIIMLCLAREYQIYPSIRDWRACIQTKKITCRTAPGNMNNIRLLFYIVFEMPNTTTVCFCGLGICQ